MVGIHVSLEWLNSFFYCKETKWSSTYLSGSDSFVIVKKPSGALVIYLDPTDLNKEIIRPICNTQTIDDVIDKLRHTKYFAVFDTGKGFFHVPLEQESKLLTAMLTLFGTCV